jgi:hypothetical protein
MDRKLACASRRPPHAGEKAAMMVRAMIAHPQAEYSSQQIFQNAGEECRADDRNRRAEQLIVEVDLDHARRLGC